MDEHDTMIVLQVEYNKMTGEKLEEDVALEMVKAIRQDYMLKSEHEKEIDSITISLQDGFKIAISKLQAEMKELS